MIKPVADVKTRTIVASLLVNFLVSWTVMPVVIPPFRFYSFRELIEVLLWQGMGAIGWPMGCLGAGANLLFHGKASDLVSLLSLLIYPAMLFLLLFVLYASRAKRWGLVLLHLLLAFSFAAVWYGVLNGYDFMRG
jgi:hypothetical protein